MLPRLLSDCSPPDQDHPQAEPIRPAPLVFRDLQREDQAVRCADIAHCESGGSLYTGHVPRNACPWEVLGQSNSNVACCSTACAGVYSQGKLVVGRHQTARRAVPPSRCQNPSAQRDDIPQLRGMCCTTRGHRNATRAWPGRRVWAEWPLRRAARRLHVRGKVAHWTWATNDRFWVPGYPSRQATGHSLPPPTAHRPCWRPAEARPDHHLCPHQGGCAALACSHGIRGLQMHQHPV